jgi:hypothetical protein
MTMGLAILGLTACATTGPATPTESVVTADPRHGIPPATRESDPEVTERRFGFSEARARREAKARAEAEQGNRVDVESVKEPGKKEPEKKEPEKKAVQSAGPTAPPEAAQNTPPKPAPSAAKNQSHTQHEPGAAKPETAPPREAVCPSCKPPSTPATGH